MSKRFFIAILCGLFLLSGCSNDSMAVVGSDSGTQTSVQPQSKPDSSNESMYSSVSGSENSISDEFSSSCPEDKSQQDLQSQQPPERSTSSGTIDILPTSYDLRNENLLTSVRNQSPFGTCWAFAGICSAETALLKQGVTDENSTTLDLSEEALLWGACGNTLRDGTGWQNKSKNDGGYPDIVCGFIVSRGVYCEKDIPYVTDDSENYEEYYISDDYPEQLDSISPVYRATDIVYIDTGNPDEIKSAIMKWGSVSAGFYDDGNYREDIPAYWTPKKEYNNHQISIVGWDDEYPSENFLGVDGKKPENDGAWLVKNSYGKEFGDDGFMWISYKDKSLFTLEDNDFETISAYVVKGMAPITDETYLFQNDIYGAVTDKSENDAMWANVYDFSLGKKYISSVTFETRNGIGQKYSIYYAPVEDDGTPVTDISKMTLLKTGTVEYNGYSTVSINNKFEVPRENGAIVIRIDGNSSIGVQTTLIDRERGLFLLPENPGTGLSFMICDGRAEDLSSEHTIVSIKVSTQD